MTNSNTLTLPQLQLRFTYASALTFTLYAAMLALFCYWNLSRDSGINWTIFSLQTLPLLALLPGLYTRYYRAFSWLCFVDLLYFVMASLGAFKSTADYLDYLFFSLTILLFCTSMFASRWAQRVQKFTRTES